MAVMKRNIDNVHRNTSKQLKLSEKAINKMYKDASANAASAGAAFFNKFKSEWDEKRRQLTRGNISITDWVTWASDTVFKNEGFEGVCDELIDGLTGTDAESRALIDEIRTNVYVYSHNYTAYTIENTFYDVSFSIVNESTVKLLQAGKTPILPVLTANTTKAQKWLQKRIRQEVTAGILNGESIPKMAKRLANVSNMSRATAVRTARTACTSAENAGRQDVYEDAADQGLILQKQWICTVDSRTRSSHASIDGEIVRYDDKFSNGVKYPGDPSGPPKEVYNCRCTMVTVDPVASEGERRVNHPSVDGDVLEFKTFDEYIVAKGSD